MTDFSRDDIAQVIADEFGMLASDIDPIQRLDSLTDDFDEFDRMNLCANLETALDIKIESGAEDKWVTVRDVYETCESLAGAAVNQ